jgi:hypothetical protein
LSSEIFKKRKINNLHLILDFLFGYAIIHVVKGGVQNTERQKNMMGYLKWQHYKWARHQSKLVLKCAGCLSGTIMGEDMTEAQESLREINANREKLHLEAIVLEAIVRV